MRGAGPAQGRGRVHAGVDADEHGVRVPGGASLAGSDGAHRAVRVAEPLGGGARAALLDAGRRQGAREPGCGGEREQPEGDRPGGRAGASSEPRSQEGPEGEEPPGHVPEGQDQRGSAWRPLT